MLSYITAMEEKGEKKKRSPTEEFHMVAMQTSTHTTRQSVPCPCSKSTRTMCQNQPSRSDCSHFNSKPSLLYVPSFVPATNSVLNRIIITEEITHIKPRRCHLPGNLGCRPPVEAWQDIRCMGNEICINSVAPSLIYFCLFTLSAREEKKGRGNLKKMAAEQVPADASHRRYYSNRHQSLMLSLQ